MSDLADKYAFTLSDGQRLIRRSDVEGVCESPSLCFEYSDTARCYPCASKAAALQGVSTNEGLPALPEVSRLKRQVAAQAAEIARLREALEPANNIEILTERADDSDVVIMTLGTIRKMRAALKGADNATGE